MKKEYSYILILIMLLGFNVILAQVDNESNFYTPVAHSNYNKNLVTDFLADTEFATDDSSILQTAIDEISANGGGILTIPAGNYSLSDIIMKSNVHLNISSGAVIRPSVRPDQKNYQIFGFGRTGATVINTTIYCGDGGRFKIDLTHNNNPNVTVFSCFNVKNFVLANFDVDDVFTKFSSVAMGLVSYNGTYYLPENGIVKDANVINAAYGYGLVQTQAATNILFKNLSGTGGATLRLETGLTSMNNLQRPGQARIGGIDKIVARNISCTNGNSAVMVSPHAMHNGTVDVDGVYGYSAGFALRIEAGFVSKDYDQNIGLVDGTFGEVKVKNVTALYGTLAQIKPKHYKYIPEEIKGEITTISTDGGESFTGPAIAAVLNDANYICKDGVLNVVLDESTVVSNGFSYQEPVIPAEFRNIDCTSLSVNKNKIDTGKLSLFLNPTSEFVTINSTSKMNEIEVYNVSGALVNRVSNLKDNYVFSLDVTPLVKGIYFLKISTDEGMVNRKMIVN